MIIYAAYFSTYIHRFTLNIYFILNIYKQNQHPPRNVSLSLLLPKFQFIFKKSSYFCCYVSVDTLIYFGQPTGRL